MSRFKAAFNVAQGVEPVDSHRFCSITSVTISLVDKDFRLSRSTIAVASKSGKGPQTTGTIIGVSATGAMGDGSFRSGGNAFDLRFGTVSSAMLWMPFSSQRNKSWHSLLTTTLRPCESTRAIQPPSRSSSNRTAMSCFVNRTVQHWPRRIFVCIIFSGCSKKW